jgi:hypothetical protein
VAYVNCELNGTLVACAIDDETGLAPLQAPHGVHHSYSVSLVGEKQRIQQGGVET